MPTRLGAAILRLFDFLGTAHEDASGCCDAPHSRCRTIPSCSGNRPDTAQQTQRTLGAAPQSRPHRNVVPHKLKQIRGTFGKGNGTISVTFAHMQSKLGERLRLEGIYMAGLPPVSFLSFYVISWGDAELTYWEWHRSLVKRI